MAHEIISGFDLSGEDPDDSSLLGFQPVDVKIGEDIVKAIALHDMPAEQVMDLMMSPRDIRLAKTMWMLSLAVGVPANARMEVATFQEMFDATNSWIVASNHAKDL